MRFQATANQLVSRICKQRQGLDRSLALDFLNERIRTVLDRRPYWSGTLKRTVISIPNQYTTGTITTTVGSPIIQGSATAWPVNDVVNTVIEEPVQAQGVMWVTPASLAGITLDTVMYIDSGGTYPEICPVIDILAGRIKLNFQYPHNAGATATASSLNGLQLRLNSTNPVFTVLAVTSPTTLTLDTPWGAATQSGGGYQILLMYTVIADDVKELINATDPFQQIALRLHVQQEELNGYDPNRTATNSPTCLADLGPNANGSMVYEIYPPQSFQYQLYVQYNCQWPDMRLPTDMPPPFIQSGTYIYGALADAFRTWCGRPPGNSDPGYSLENSAMYEQMFEKAVIDSMAADESLAQKAFSYDWGRVFGFGLGAAWEQCHDYDASQGNF